MGVNGYCDVGKMDFTTKIFTVLFGGMDNLIGNQYEKSLTNIEKKLKSKVNFHSIISDGFIETTIGDSSKGRGEKSIR